MVYVPLDFFLEIEISPKNHLFIRISSKTNLGVEAGHEVGNDIQQDQSMDMETGDWTLDSSRTRLHEFFLEVIFLLKFRQLLGY